MLSYYIFKDLCLQITIHLLYDLRDDKNKILFINKNKLYFYQIAQYIFTKGVS